MAEESGKKGFENSVFADYIETNTKQKPYIYYNMGVYVTLYNRIRGDLQNNFDGDLSTFDTVINQKIKEGLSGSKAEVEAFLHQYGYDGMLKIYEDGEVNDSNRAQVKKNDYDYMVSNLNFIAEFDRTVALARDLTRIKYGKDANKRAMLSYDDAREVLHVKEKKSDSVFYEASRAMTANAGGLDAKGKKAGGILNTAMRTAEAKLQGMKKNRRLGFWRAVGWAALAVGTTVLTGGLGIATLGVGGQALGGLFGVLYSGGVGGVLGGVVATGVSGYAALTSYGKFVGRVSLNWKNGRKLRDFKYSRGKYAEADYSDFDNMGYKRLKMEHDEHVALKKFYDNYSAGKPVTKRKGSLMAIDYVPKEYRAAFNRKLDKEGIFGANARTAETLYSNAKHHRMVANRDLKPGEFGYYSLYKHMNQGVEGYETSTLTPDEVILNYGTEVTSGTGAKPRLHEDVIREHKGYPDELSYITAKLNEFVGYEETFKKGSQMGEFAKGLERFVEAYNTSFATSLFENPYTPKIIGDAQNIMNSPQFKKMIEQTNSGESEAALKGVLGFLAAERDNISEREPKQLSDSVGVGIERQLDMSKDSLVAACSSLGDDSDETKEVAELVASMTTCSSKFVGGKLVLVADPTVVGRVDALADPAKKYLKHMLDVKLSQCKIAANETLASEGAPVPAILTRIYALTKSDRAADIRTQIANGLRILDTDTPDIIERKTRLRQQLSDVLDAQIMALETKVRDDSKLSAIKGIRAGSTKFAELLEEIGKIESNVEIPKIQELMHKIEMQAQRPELIDYLKLRVKDKIVHELKYFANNADNFAKGTSEDNLKELMAFIRKISSLYSSGCLDQWQFESLMSTLSVQIERTMNAYLYDVEKLFLENTDEKINALNKLLTLSAKEGQGLKEFFDMNTPESIRIWSKADIYRQGLAVRDFMTMTSTGSYGGFVDSKSGDIQSALYVYFKKHRNSTDNLRNVFSMIDGNISQMDYNQDIDFISAMPERKPTTTTLQLRNDDGSYTDVEIPEFEGLDTCKKIIGTGNLTLPDTRYSFVMSVIETLKSDSFKEADHEERLAALTVLKRKIAGMMRVQMVQLYQKKGSGEPTPNDFYNNHRDELNNNLINGWKELAEIVDKIIVACKNNLPAGSTIGNTIEPNTVRIVNSICQPSKYSTIMTQQQMMG